MKNSTHSFHINRSTMLCTVLLHWLNFSGLAQPHYVQVGTLPVPTASERAEVFDSATGTLFSFPYYNSGDLTSVYATHPGTNDTFTWTQTTNFQPARTTYWGRGTSDGSHLYFCGTIDDASMWNSFGVSGVLTNWQSMTPLPTSGCSGSRCPLRSLHQTFVFQSRLYVLGGWYGDGLPAYADTWYAPIQADGTLGNFVQTIGLPYGMAGHSATVTPNGWVYLAHDTNLFASQIMANGSISNWIAQLTVPSMNLNNDGNTAIAVVSNLLVIVDYNGTYVCHLNGSGQVDSVAATIANPAYLQERSVYANNGKIYVTGTSGSAYRIDGLPTVPVVPHTATASAVLDNGFVVGANITDGGSGYTNTPTVRIIGGGGTGAQALAVVSNGMVVAVNVLAAGSAYTNAPLVVIEPPFIPNPVLGVAGMSFLTFSNLTVGGVYQLQQLAEGYYWTNQPVNFTATNAVYTEMVSGTMDSGEYRLALSPVPAQAFAVPQVVSGFVVGATVTGGGSGYVTNPPVSIIGWGTNAGAVSQISGGVVTNIAITNAGIGYTNTTTLEIGPPPAAATLPTIQLVVQVNSANLAPYDNYQIQFTPTLGATWGNWNGGLFSSTSMTNSQYLFVTNAIGFFRLQYAP